MMNGEEAKTEAPRAKKPRQDNITMMPGKENVESGALSKAYPKRSRTPSVKACEIIANQIEAEKKKKENALVETNAPVDVRTDAEVKPVGVNAESKVLPKVQSTKPKKAAVEPKTATAKPKVSSAEPKTATAKPKVSSAEPKTATAKPKVSSTEPKVATAKPKVSSAKPKTATPKQKVSSAEPKTKQNNKTTKQKSASSSAGSSKGEEGKRKRCMPKTVDKLLEQMDIKADTVSCCLKSAMSKGFIRITGDASDLEQVVCEGKYDDHTYKVLVKDVLYQPDYAGCDYEDGCENATAHCSCCNDDGDEEYGRAYVTRICQGQAELDSGKFHNHCTMCKGFGVCINDYREAHCEKCNKHWFQGNSGFPCDNCQRQRGRGFGGLFMGGYDSNDEDESDENRADGCELM